MWDEVCGTEHFRLTGVSSKCLIYSVAPFCHRDGGKSRTICAKRITKVNNHHVRRSSLLATCAFNLEGVCCLFDGWIVRCFSSCTRKPICYRLTFPDIKIIFSILTSSSDRCVARVKETLGPPCRLNSEITGGASVLPIELKAGQPPTKAIKIG